MENKYKIAIFGIILASISFYAPALAVSKFEISDGSVKALWHLNENTSASTFTDETGNNNLSIVNLNTATSGILNNAQYANGNYGVGTNTYAHNTSPSGLPSGNGAFTIGAWFKCSDPGENAVSPGATCLSNTNQNDLYNQEDNVWAGTNQIEFNYYNGQLVAYTDGGGGGVLFSGASTITAGTWHFGVFTYDGAGTEKLYLDGSLKATQGSLTNSVNATEVQIGKRNSADYFWLPSSPQDETFVLNKALSSTDITSLWNGGLGKEICLTTGCSAGSDTITITTPPNASSINYDFNQWIAQYVNNGDISGVLPPCAAPNHLAGAKIILYTTSTLTNPISTDYTNTENCYGSGTSTIYITKHHYLTANTSYWTKIIKTINGSETNVSSTINFDTGAISYTLDTNPPLTGLPPNFSTSTNATSSYFFVDCSGYDNTSFFSSATIANLGCQSKKVAFQIIGFLIIPPDFISGYLVNSFKDTLTLPPFGIVNSIITEFTSQTNTGSTSTLAIALPEINLNATIITSSTLQNVFTNSQCNSTCATNIKNTIFDYITNILWIMSAIAITFFIMNARKRKH